MNKKTYWNNWLLYGIALVLTLILIITNANAMEVIDFTGQYVPDRFGRPQCNIDVLYYPEQDVLVMSPSFFDMVAQVRGD